ncbi:MAG: DUF177 domain-containing protein [Gemmatimonadota bacterium]
MTMLRLDLLRLDRDRNVEISAEIPPDDAMWKGLETGFSGPVSVVLHASLAGGGGAAGAQIVVRGMIRGGWVRECRRCLEGVAGLLETEVTWVFQEAGLPGAEEGGDVHLYAGGATDLNLTDAVREEVLLAIDPYVVCDSECRGLCPMCGTNLNEGVCDCTRAEPDPRWDALRTLKS